MASGRIVLVVACVPVLALAACGGGGGGSTLTKAQYDVKVSRLCLLASDQIRELHMDRSVSAWKYSGADVIRIARHFDNALAALGAPADIAADADVYLRANTKVLADDKAALAAAQAADLATLRKAIEQSNNDSLAAWPSAKAIGATGCYTP